MKTILDDPELYKKISKQILDMKNKYLYKKDDEIIGLENELKDYLVNGKELKLALKKQSEFIKSLEKSKYNRSKEERLKFYKIYFLGNMGDINIHPLNFNYGGAKFVNSLDTGLDMLQAEEYLIRNNWNLEDTLSEIKYKTGKLENYKIWKYDFRNLVSFLDAKRYSNSFLLILVIPIIIGLLYELYISL